MTDALAEPVSVAPEPTPPDHRLTPRQWMKTNLFSTPFNTALTVVAMAGIALVLFEIGWWITVTADWKIVEVNLRGFMIGGRYPTDQLWRLWASLFTLAATAGFALGVLVRTAERRQAENGDRDHDEEGEGDDTAAPGDRVVSMLLAVLHRFWPLLLAVVVVLGFTRTILPTLLAGGLVVAFLLARRLGLAAPLGPRWLWLFVVAGLIGAFLVVTAGSDGVSWDSWGGLHLSVFATITGIALAFPLGLVLALGRRSSLPAIRVVCVAFIELFRAVPLVTLLFMGDFMIGFFIPTWMDTPSRLARAIIAITLFQSAYIAEIVRGGLQSVPRGQIEAAQAVGLSPTRVQRLVVLPQALRAVIPAMVGQFISLFKDTSLLAILSFPDLLRVAQVAPQTDAFRGQGLLPVTLAFVGFLYWAGCITMSKESRRLERRLGVGER